MGQKILVYEKRLPDLFVNPNCFFSEIRRLKVSFKEYGSGFKQVELHLEPFKKERQKDRIIIQASLESMKEIFNEITNILNSLED